MARSGLDAKVFALNAESEYYEQMAFMTHSGPVPQNVRIFDFPLSSHGGGGVVPCNNVSYHCRSRWKSGRATARRRRTIECSRCRRPMTRG